MARSHEFIVTRDLYTEVETEPGIVQIKLVKKDLKTKYLCRDLSRITSCEETYTDRGKLKTNHTKITVDGEGEKIVQMKYKEVKQLLEEPAVSVGFKAKE